MKMFQKEMNWNNNAMATFNSKTFTGFGRKFFIDTFIQPILLAKWIDKSTTTPLLEHQTVPYNLSSLRKRRSAFAHLLPFTVIIHLPFLSLSIYLILSALEEKNCWKLDENKTWNWMISSCHSTITTTNVIFRMTLSWGDRKLFTP